MTRRCTKCQQEGPPEMFNRRPSGKDGLSSRCRKCTCVYAKAQYSKHRLKALARNAVWRGTHVEYDKDRKAKWYATAREHSLNRMSAWRYAVRSRAIEVLGGKCACCGESRETMLEIDHVNNDGAAHRSEAKGGVYRTYREMAASGVRNPRFQVLCANCNASKHRNGGSCEHASESRSDEIGFCA